MKLEEIFSFENLYCAYKNCRKSKQHKGEVVRFEANLSVYLYTLIEQITHRKYRLGLYKRFYIYEPKERLIEALPFKDRIVIRCFCDVVLRPKIEKKLIYDNCACRKGKGTHFAISRLHEFLRKTYRAVGTNQFYFLKCDIYKYFPSIHHEILLSLLKKVEFSLDEMWFIKKLVLEQPNDVNVGLPLGNQSSQWFALLYLNSLDHYIKEVLHIKYYVRYMDDMVLIHPDKVYLAACKKQIEQFCKEQLALQLNGKTQIGMVKNGIDFLGYRHILTATGKLIIRLRYSSKCRMKKHAQTVGKLYRKKIVDCEYVLIRKNAFYNHVKITNEKEKFKNDLFSFI